MEGGNHGGGYPNYGNSRKHLLVPPPMTAIGRFLQGQSSQSNSSHHYFEKNKEQFIPSNGLYGFSSSPNEGVGGMYNQYEVSSVSCLPMDKMSPADHGVYSISYRNMHVNNEVAKSSTKMKLKGGSRKNDLQAAGFDTRPPMLDRTDYESWSQQIRLYCRGKENGLQILQSIDQGPFELGTTRSTLGTTPERCVLLGPERPRTYDDLSDMEKKQYDADVRATNIVLQGLPKDMYKLIIHNIKAKTIWDNVKMLLAAVRYLKQHKKHAAQDRLIIERITPTTNDQLAFVSTVRPYAQSSHVQSYQYPSSSAAPQSLHIQSLQHLQFPKTSQIDSGYTQTDEILDNLTKQMAHLAQSFRATLPQTNNQLQSSSNTRNQATIQDGRVVVQNVQGQQNHNQNQRYFARGNSTAGNGGAQNRAGNANAGQDVAGASSREWCSVG
ncbi:hypothetical protein Tco_0001034 [Tanacetum coccineum]